MEQTALQMLWVECFGSDFDTTDLSEIGYRFDDSTGYLYKYEDEHYLYIYSCVTGGTCDMENEVMYIVLQQKLQNTFGEELERLL